MAPKKSTVTVSKAPKTKIKSATGVSKAKPARKIVKPKGKAQGKKATNADEMIEVEQETKTLVPTDIFQTFKIDARPGLIKSGLNIIRPLGHGQYEIVSLDGVDQNNLGSVETGEFIKSDPKRLAMMKVTKTKWDSAKLKCDIAVRVTEADLFRFFKLPLELREKIIKLVVTPSNGIRYNRTPTRACPAIALMQSCRQMYEESQRFYWSNSFYVEHMELKDIRKDPLDNYFFNNVSKMTYTWNGNVRDPTAFRFINSFPQLKELNVRINHHTLSYDRYYRGNLNSKYRNEESFGKFRIVYGLDSLLSIRGLQRATLEVFGKTPLDQATEDARTMLESCMMENLKLPPVNPKKGAKHGIEGKVKASESDGNESEDGSDFEEEVYIARPTRSRTSGASMLASVAGPSNNNDTYHYHGDDE